MRVRCAHNLEGIFSTFSDPPKSCVGVARRRALQFCIFRSGAAGQDGGGQQEGGRRGGASREEVLRRFGGIAAGKGVEARSAPRAGPGSDVVHHTREGVRAEAKTGRPRAARLLPLLLRMRAPHTCADAIGRQRVPPARLMESTQRYVVGSNPCCTPDCPSVAPAPPCTPGYVVCHVSCCIMQRRTTTRVADKMTPLNSARPPLAHMTHRRKQPLLLIDLSAEWVRCAVACHRAACCVRRPRRSRSQSRRTPRRSRWRRRRSTRRCGPLPISEGTRLFEASALLCGFALSVSTGLAALTCAGTRTAHRGFPVGASVGDRRRAAQGRRQRAARGGPSLHAGTRCVYSGCSEGLVSTALVAMRRRTVQRAPCSARDPMRYAKLSRLRRTCTAAAASPSAQPSRRASGAVETGLVCR
jgi:hypothetical protein